MMRVVTACFAIAATLAAQRPPARRSAPPEPAPAFNGASALEFTRKAVSFGQRPSGSQAIRKLQVYLHSELARFRCEIRDDDFTAQTPLGPVAMQNIVARFPGTTGRVVAITGHYDTKSMPGTYFPGANDGGSSTGFLLELARVLARMPHRNEIDLVWFDGEEAVGEWSDTNGTFGSRHLARKWADDGTLGRLKALINVDMMGDRDLNIVNDENSSSSLRRLIWDTAAQIGLSKYFLTDPYSILDDHIPFVKAGVNAADLIDFSYGPDNSWWHTEKDTMDKLSAGSFHTVGAVVVETIKKLE